MTDVLEAPPAERTPSRPGERPAPSLRWDAGALLGAMLVIGLVLGARGSFTDDEANVWLQATAIAHGHWVLPDAFPLADPRHLDFFAENVTATATGFAPLAKHLTYCALVSPLVRIAGFGGLMALSAVGTVIAALCSARLTRAWAGGHERAAFWITAVSSPLWFYGFVATGQAVGAAAVGCAVVASLAYLSSGRRTAACGAALAMGLAVAAREEAMVFALAACLTAPLLLRRGTGDGSSVRRVVGLVAALAGGTVAIRALDLVLAHRLADSPQPVGQNASALLGGNTLLAQLRGFVIAAAGPGQGGDPFSQTDLVVLALTVAGIALAVVAARALRDTDPAPVLCCAAALSAACFVARTWIEPTAPVAGLLPAFPLLWGGLWLVGRPEVRTAETRWAAAMSALFAAGVAASLYSDGGGLQWGGRYFDIAIPVLVPLIAATVARHTAPWGPATRRLLAGCMAVVTTATAWQSLGAIDAAHRAGAAAASELEAAAAVAPAGDGGKPVVVSTAVALGLLWSAAPELRMLRTTDASGLSDLAARLYDGGVERLILADHAFSLRGDESALARWYRPVATVRPEAAAGGWVTIVLAADKR